MPKQSLIKKNFSFIGGINTDSGFLQQVPNSWKEGDNMVPFLDGHVERRVRMDLESGYELSTTISENYKETYAFSVGVWKNVGGDGSLYFAVAQMGPTLHFYDCVDAQLSINKKSFTLDLTTYKSPNHPGVFGTNPVSLDSSNGKLLITAEDIDPILVNYNATTDAITATRLTLKIRDFYGVVDTTPITTNPAVLTDTHGYNLENQGWTATAIASYLASTATYPDDTQIWIQGKDTSGNFSPSVLDQQDFGTASAPKGRYILDVFNRDRDAVATGSYPSLVVELENFRPSTGCLFAGRAWYSGIQSSTIASWVLFSRVADTDIKYEQCYQEGDPTAEFTNDLVASDGGVIPIVGAGGILLLKPLDDGILVFAKNGIWQIVGDTAGFKADSYQVKQVASFGINSAQSVVDVESSVVFWGTSGIYTLVKDQATGGYSPKSISLGKVQTLYQEIQQTTYSQYVRGFYDSVEKIVYWIYHGPNHDHEHLYLDRFECYSILALNVSLEAFYTMSIATIEDSSPVIVGGFLSPNSGNSLSDFAVVAGGVLVLAGGVQVITGISVHSHSPRIPKFLTIVPSGSEFAISFSDFLSVADTPEKFMDWYSFDDVGVETTTLPYVLTGYDLVDDGVRDHQAPYIYTYLRRTETGFDEDLNPLNPSSCTLQGRWGWTDATISGRWTSGEEVYRHRTLYIPVDTDDTYADGFPLIVAKSKMRGHGKSLQLKFGSASGKEMQLSGWAIQYTIETGV